MEQVPITIATKAFTEGKTVFEVVDLLLHLSTEKSNEELKQHILFVIKESSKESFQLFELSVVESFIDYLIKSKSKSELDLNLDLRRVEVANTPVSKFCFPLFLSCTK